MPSVNNFIIQELLIGGSVIRNCLQCGKETKNPKFCSLSCSAKYTNLRKTYDAKNGKCIICQEPIYKNAKYCEEHKLKKINTRTKSQIIEKTCVVCGKTWESWNSNSRYCSIECQSEYKYNEFISRWLSGEINGSGKCSKLSAYVVRYVLEKANYKCEECGFNKVHPRTGKPILEIHHIDENPENSTVENLKVLCPNCHSFIDSKDSKKGNGRRYYRQEYYKDKNQ